MHLYWRIIEELKFLGEMWIIKDPSLARRYAQWLQKNAAAIYMIDAVDDNHTETGFDYKGIQHSLN